VNVPHQPLTDVMIDSTALPWVPQAENVWFKPLRLSLETNTWANLLKIKKSGKISTHRHIGAVEGWVMQGSWRYLEHDWTAQEGAYVYAAPGDVHTLVVEGDEGMTTLFHIHGTIEYLGDDGSVARVETAQSKLDLYLQYCEEHGLEVQPVVF
jgi:2,4'-dihydroxyacetophenone dioxygenase